MRLFRLAAVLVFTISVLAVPANAHAQSIDPPTYSATMAVGETITINKTITLGAEGANLVDLFFLTDATGSMYSTIADVKAGASAILAGVPTGADYTFGAGHYQGDPSEYGETLASAYVQDADLGTFAAAQAGINSWWATGGGDGPEANFYALQQVSNTSTWRTGSQRLVVWFGDYASHTETTTEAQAIAALNAEGITVIAFNNGGDNGGIDGCYGLECNQADDIVAATGGSVTHSFTSSSGAALAAAVNAEILTATSTLDLIFGTDFFSLYSGGLSFTFTCTDALGCTGVNGGESRTFDVGITAVTPGSYDFSVFASGVSAEELDHITVLGEGGAVIPEPATVALLGTGLLGLGFMAWRRKEDD